MKSHVSKSKRVALLGRGLKCDPAVEAWLMDGLVEAALAIMGIEAEANAMAVDIISGRMIDLGMLSLL